MLDDWKLTYRVPLFLLLLPCVILFAMLMYTVSGALHDLFEDGPYA